MSMQLNDFTEIATMLDTAVSQSEQDILAAAIQAQNKSLLHGGRGEYPYWSFEFTKVWELDLETAQVRVLLSHHDASGYANPATVKAWCCAEQFRQGQASRIREIDEHSIPAGELAGPRLGNFVINTMRRAAAQLKQDF